jgi:hypothetical protein
MGFMDKAKKLAEQAQEKLDEQQAKLNDRSRGAAEERTAEGPAGPEGDAAPARPAPTSAPPPYTPPGPGSPLPPFPPAPPEFDEEHPAQRVAPGVEAPPSRGPGSPIPPAPPSPMREDDVPPTLSSGDPLAG